MDLTACRVMARLRPSDLCRERPLIGADRKWLAEAQNVANDPNRTLGPALKSASRLAKGLTAAGVGIASIAIIGLYWN
jgi:hypothetical protein